MKSRFLALLAATSVVLAVSATADAASRARASIKKTVLVELFTSQG